MSNETDPGDSPIDPAFANVMHTAATHCDGVYNEIAVRNSKRRYTEVNQFLIGGVLMAYVEEDENNVYVVFRGTKDRIFPPGGDWVFTNFQAYKTECRFFLKEPPTDRSQADDAERIHEAVAYRLLRGKVHQGFYRATSWLWYGCEPLLDFETVSPSRWRKRLVRHVAIVLIAFVVCAFVLWRLGIADWLMIGISFGLLILLFIANWEVGAVQGLLRIPPKLLNSSKCALRDHLDTPTDKMVWFVGHSLGGAIASLAFTIYRAQGNTTCRLITFGAPRFGDQDCLDHFTELYASEFLNVVNTCDPVPETPPTGELMTLVRRGILCIPLFLATIGFWAYSLFYPKSNYGKWKRRVLLFGDKNGWLSLAAHKMETSYLPWARECSSGTANNR